MPYRAYMESRILTLPDGHVLGGFWDGEPAARGPRAVGYLEQGRTDQMGDFPGPHWALDGNGDLALTPRNLATWTRALFSGHVIPPAAVREVSSGGFRRGNGQSETAGWVAVDRSVYGVPFFITAGGGGDVGHDVVVVWLPRDRRAIAIASNTPGITAEQLLQAVGPALLAGRPLPLPQTANGRADPRELRAAAGRYRLRSGGSFEVSRRGRGLAVAARGADAVAALFPLPRDVTPAAARANERRALTLLRGDTAERRGIESAYGRIAKVRLAGTMVADGELRTYLTIHAASKRVTGWYALDEAGAVSAAQVPAEPPTQLLAPAGKRRYRPRDPTGRAPALAVRIADNRLSIRSRGRRVTARR